MTASGTPVTLEDKVNRRRGELELDRSSYIGHWKDIQQYLLPRSGRFEETDVNNGGKKHGSIIDNTGTRAINILAAGLMAGATSPARPWFRLTTPDPKLAERPAVKEWLYQLGYVMRLVFDRSNTYRALPRVYKELAGFGTAVSIIEEDFENIIHHTTLTAGEYCLATDHRGVVDTFSRVLMFPVDDMVRKFGYGNVSVATRTAFDNYEYNKLVTVVHLVQPDAAFRANPVDRENIRPGKHPVRSVYIEYGSDATGRAVLRDSGYRRFPALCPRWETLGLDAYGSGCPGMTALGDLKQLQHDQIMRAKAVDYQADPPVQVPVSMRNQESDLLPGGVSYVEMTGPHGGIRTAFDVPLNLSHLDNGILDIRQRINAAFYADLFLMLINDQRSNVTAREVAERHEEKLLMLGPVLESVHNELLGPMIDLTFDRILEAGVMPPAPKELEAVDLKVEFVSMLAQAQKAVGLAGVDRMIGTVGALATHQLNAGKSPDVWDKLDVDQVIDQYADMLGLDPTLVVPDDEVEAIRTQRAQAQRVMQAQQAAATAADTAKKLSETKTGEDNALSNVVNMFSGYQGA